MPPINLCQINPEDSKKIAMPWVNVAGSTRL
jgi:hypothetical protein